MNTNAVPMASANTTGSSRSAAQLAQVDASLLPTTWRTPEKLIEVPQGDLESFLHRELRTDRLASIQSHLWMVGRPVPPRPLHAQILMSREIIITEQIDLHLVWTEGKIFIKPLPRYLLDGAFRTAHIDHNPELGPYARGLLHSYTALVAYESDFRIAHGKGLLPSNIEWTKWHEIAQGLVLSYPASRQNVYKEIDARYLYGELRLSRLNKIYRFLKGDMLYGYSRETALSLSSEFFAENFGQVAAVLAYVVIVLTAMQVGLADDLLSNNAAFKRACYGFTIFSIVAPLAAAVLILAAFLYMFVSHWIRTRHNEARRRTEMGIATKRHAPSTQISQPKPKLGA